MQSSSDVELSQIKKKVLAQINEHVQVLKQALVASFEGLETFQLWIKGQMTELGLDVEEFTVGMDELERQPAMLKSLRDKSAEIPRAPNLVGTLRARSDERVAQPGERGLLVFAHADKPSITYTWGKEFRGEYFRRGNLLVGPGIADDVAGVAAILSAVRVLRDLNWTPRTELRVASVLGKQLGVFGTYGLVSKYTPNDAALYVHPPASEEGMRDLIIGALGMVEFKITVIGKPPETSEPWKPIFEKTAVNPIYKGLSVVSRLRAWADETERKQLYRHEAVEAVTGRSFVVSIGQFLAGAESSSYAIPSRSEIGGVVHFSPRASVRDVKNGLIKVIETIKSEDPWLSKGHLEFEWGDVIADSFEVESHNSFVQAVKGKVQTVTGISPRFYFGHSVSDLRYPVLWWGVPAVGLGPKAGNLGQPDEYIVMDEYVQTITVLASLIADFA